MFKFRKKSTVSSAVLQTINISPSTSITLPIGLSQQYTATGIFSDASTQSLTSSAIWSSSNSSVATINNSGSSSSGLATAIGLGSTTINASYSGISGSASLTVPNAVLQSITITPVIGNTLVGNNQQLIANGVFSDGSVQNLSSTVTWASSNTSILSVNSTGFMNIVRDGSATITASLGSISGTMTPNVISYVYAANQGNNISMYSVNSANGQLTPLSPAIIATTNPVQLTIANVSSGSYLYTVNNSSNTVSMFSINSANGQLTPLSPATIVTGANSRAIAVANTNSGSYAYVVNATGNTVSMFSINSANGQLTALSPATIAAGSSPSGAAVATTALGTFLYISSQSASNNVSMFSINTANGQLTALSPATVSAGISPFSIAVTPSGNYAYTANTGTADSSMFRIQPNGQLTPLVPSSIATASAPVVVTVSPSGNNVYVGCQSNFVSSYSLDPVSGLLTLLGNIPGGSATSGVTVTPSGNYAYAGNQGSNTVSMYSISSNGVLTPIGSIATGALNTFGVVSR